MYLDLPIKHEYSAVVTQNPLDPQQPRTKATAVASSVGMQRQSHLAMRQATERYLVS